MDALNYNDNSPYSEKEFENEWDPDNDYESNKNWTRGSNRKWIRRTIKKGSPLNNKNVRNKTIKNLSNKINAIASIYKPFNHPQTSIINEIIIGIYCHGFDYPNEKLPPKLTKKVRMCVSGEMNDFHYSCKKTYVDLLYDSLIENNVALMKWRDRKNLVESSLKKIGLDISDEQLKRGKLVHYAKASQITNQRIKHIKPIHDHLYDSSISPSYMNKEIGNFMAIYSTNPSDEDYTYDRVGRCKKLNATYCDMVKSPYWEKKKIFTHNEIISKKILLSDLLERLQKNGYENIYIIDMSCRAISDKNMNRAFQEYNPKNENSPGTYSKSPNK